MSRWRLNPQTPTESAVLDMIKRALRVHPHIVWFERMNSAAGKLQYPGGGASQFMRFGFKGMPDILGQLRDGRLLAIEAKRPGGQRRPEQEAFIEKARKHGAAAGFAESVPDAIAIVEGRA